MAIPRGEEVFGPGGFARFARNSYHFRRIDTLGVSSEHRNERGTVEAPGQTLWLAVFIQAEEPILPPFFGISLFEDGEERLFLGRGTAEQRRWKIQTEYEDALSGEYIEPHWIALRIDFRNDGSEGADRDRVTMFLNPDPSGPEPDFSEAAGQIFPKRCSVRWRRFWARRLRPLASVAVIRRCGRWPRNFCCVMLA